MNYLYRLSERIYREGVPRTLQYVATVTSDTLKNAVAETYLDLKYSNRLLVGNHKSRFQHLGAHDVWHTEYAAMTLIFQYVSIRPSDVLVDVGCGKGRVINYWLNQSYTNRIIGLELDSIVAAQTAEQLKKWDQVTIIQGDAIANLPEEGTIFYFYNSFSRNKVWEFEKRIHQIAGTHRVTIVYYNPKSVQVFDNGHWDIRYINFEKELGVKRWGRLNKFHDLAIITVRYH